MLPLHGVLGSRSFPHRWQQPGHKSQTPFSPRLRAQLAQLQTTLSLQMNKPAFLLKPLGAVLRQKTHKRSKSPQFNDISTSNFLKASPTHLLIVRCSSHNPHLMQPSSEAYEAEDRCFRVAVARRLMLPHPAAPNAADVVQSCHNKSAAGLICNKTSGPTAAPLLWMSAWRRCRSQACCSGQMPSRRDTLTQWHQEIH